MSTNSGSPLRSKVNNFDDAPCKDIDVDNADSKYYSDDFQIFGFR